MQYECLRSRRSCIKADRDIKCALGRCFRAPDVSGQHFRDFHMLFEEPAVEILAMTNEIVERVRELGGSTRRYRASSTLENNNAP